MGNLSAGTREKFANGELLLVSCKLPIYESVSVWVMELCYRHGGSPPAKVIRPLSSNPSLSPSSGATGRGGEGTQRRSEEHTSELQSLMRISYAVFCLKKK